MNTVHKLWKIESMKKEFFSLLKKKIVMPMINNKPSFKNSEEATDFFKSFYDQTGKYFGTDALYKKVKENWETEVENYKLKTKMGIKY